MTLSHPNQLWSHGQVNKKKYREESGYYKRKEKYKVRPYEDLELCKYHKPQMIHGVWGYIRKDEMPEDSPAQYMKEGYAIDALVVEKVFDRLHRSLARWKRVTREFPLASCGNPLALEAKRVSWRKARAYLVCETCQQKREDAKKPFIKEIALNMEKSVLSLDAMLRQVYRTVWDK